MAQSKLITAVFHILVLTLTLTSKSFADDSSASAFDSSNRQTWTNYVLNCQGCHSMDGSGVNGKVPSMKNQAGKFLHVEDGREFLVRVPGSANSALSDQELAELLNWMLVTFSSDEIPDNFVPYSESEVAHLRQTPLVKVELTRAELVDKIEALGMGRPD